MYIHQSLVKLILFLSIISCTDKQFFHDYPQGTLVTKDGTSFKTYIADTAQRQTQGLSTVLPENFEDDEAMLFPGEDAQVRRFWMPETFFDLDLIYLSKDLYILDIERGLQHYEKRFPRSKVPMGRSVFCHHVLEVKSGTTQSQSFKIGQILKWKSAKSLEEILE